MDISQVVSFQIGSLVISTIIAAFMAFVPASIAKQKGYSFGLWWFYGWMIFIVAIIHICALPDKNAQRIPISSQRNVTSTPPTNTNQSVADELKKYKELRDQGVITEEEFQTKKKQLLNLI